MGKKSRRSTQSEEAELLLEVVQRARTNAGISQRALAQKLGFDLTAVGRIERGVRALDVVEFVQIAEALDLDPPALLGEYISVLRLHHSKTVPKT